jgi:hypothetical protein
MDDSQGIGSKPCLTASDVIDGVGGTAAAARLTRQRSLSNVSNWRATNRLPPSTYLILTEALAALGKSAPSTLWGIAPAAPPARDGLETKIESRQT